MDLTKLKKYLEQYSGAADYRQQYVPERKEILKRYEFYRVAMARV